MSSALLLSIKPTFADAIFRGSKKFEFRRAIFREPDVKKVFVYASAPVSRVVGEFDIKEVLSDTPPKLWARTKRASGISEDYFSKYFEGKEIAYALRIENPSRYREAQSLSERFDIAHPPQSFRYVAADA